MPRTKDTEDNVRAVVVKRNGGRETETHMLDCHGVAVMVNEDGSIVIEAYPDSPRANGLRLYINADAAKAAAPSWARWQRVVSVPHG